MHTRSRLVAVLLCLVVAPVFTLANQQAPTQGTVPAYPFDIVKALQVASTYECAAWTSFAVGVKDSAFRSADQVVAILNAYETGEAKEGALKSQEESIKTYLRKYHDPLVSVLRGLAGSAMKPGAFASLAGIPPVMIAKKDDDLVALVYGLTTTTIYNTLRTTERERQTTVLRELLLPALRSFDAFKEFPEIKYFAVSATFGSRDFADESVLAKMGSGETLGIVVLADAARKFNAAQITDDELASQSDFYSSEYGMNGNNIKKVKVTVQ